jgi:hypothetical protein
MAKTTRKLSLLVPLCFFLAFSPVWADGKNLLDACLRKENENQNSADKMSWAYCQGKVTGVAETLLLFNMDLPKNSQVCLPKEVTIDQTIMIVTKFLKENPEKLHLSDAYLVHFALQKAFPCK